MIRLLLAILIFAVGGCVTLDESIGVAPGENAVMCVQTAIDLPYVNTTGRRFEVPDDVEFKDLTPEQIRALYDCP